MKKIIVLFVSLVFCGQSYSLNLTPVDSLTTQALTQKVDKLSTDFILLKAQNETLQKANDRITTSVYFTIGLILASFFGLGIFNYYQGNKLNTQKIENLIQASKNEIDSALPDKIAKIVDSKELKESSTFTKEISTLKSMSRDTNTVIGNILEDILILKIPSHPFHNMNSDFDNILELINLQLVSSINYMDTTLQALIVELKKTDNYLHYDKKNRLFRIIDTQLKDKYPNQTREIKELLEARVD
jgi:hypothetical protein